MKSAIYSFVATLCAGAIVSMAHGYVMIMVMDNRVTVLERIIEQTVLGGN